MLRSYDEGTHIAESSMDATAVLALYGNPSSYFFRWRSLD